MSLVGDNLHSGCTITDKIVHREAGDGKLVGSMANDRVLVLLNKVIIKATANFWGVQDVLECYEYVAEMTSFRKGERFLNEHAAQVKVEVTTELNVGDLHNQSRIQRIIKLFGDLDEFDKRICINNRFCVLEASQNTARSVV
jgi:hypothetical protein